MRINPRQLFVLLLFSAFLIMTIRPVTDPDFWWHLRTGQLIAETRAIPLSDPFSSTRLGAAWTAHEWLAELGIYELYRIGGFGLLMLLFSLMITGAYALTYLTCPPSSRPYAAGFAVLAAALASAPTWGVRPQMISLLLFAVSLFLLDLHRQTKRLRFLVPLPLLTLFWVNLHAGYFLIFAAIGTHLVGEAWETMLALRRGERPAGSPLLALTASLGISTVAALANPNGPHILAYPFKTLTSPSMQLFIQEWFSPDFHRGEWQPLAWFFLALVGGSLIGRRPVPPARLLLTLGLGYAALRSMRNVPLFAVAAAPVLGEQLTSLLSFGGSSTERPARSGRWLKVLAVTLALGVVGSQFSATLERQEAAEREAFPAAAADWILDNQPMAPLFNTYSWGGYLIWRLYPQYAVYIDGRADLYGDAFLFDYLRIYHAQGGWSERLDAARINTVVIERGEPLDDALAASPRWKQAFQDPISVIYVRVSEWP